MPNPPSPDCRPLSPVEVRVWSVDPEGLDGAALDRCSALLSVEEGARVGRHASPEARRLRLVAYALSRLALSDAVPVEPAAWRLERDSYGRPFVAGPAAGLRLRFSLTHTPGLVACAVALDRDLGLDAEERDRKVLDVDLAAAVFTPEETVWLAGIDPALVDEERLVLWTRKEAYLKARGLGLALDLMSFSVAGYPAALKLHDASTEDGDGAWLVVDHRPSPRHCMALLARRGEDEALDVRFLDGLPTGWAG